MAAKQALAGVYIFNGAEGSISWEAPRKISWVCQAVGQNWKSVESAPRVYDCPEFQLQFIFSQDGSVAHWGNA